MSKSEEARFEGLSSSHFPTNLNATSPTCKPTTKKEGETPKPSQAQSFSLIDPFGSVSQPTIGYTVAFSGFASVTMPPVPPPGFSSSVG